MDLSFFENPFLMMALLAGITASFTGGIIGSYVVTKRIAFIGGGISHAVLGGMGLFLWLGRTYDLPFLSPIQGALVFAVASAILLGRIHIKHKEREDSVIATLWAGGMSIGVIFISFTPGYNVELMNFLFGNILWVTASDLITLLALNGVVVGCTVFYYRRFQAICFDEEQAYLQGTPVQRLYMLLLCLVACSIVVLIQIVGAVLVVSMLTIPAATAAGFTTKLSGMMKAAVAAGIVFTCTGTYASYELNWPPGATITLIGATAYAIGLCLRKRKRTI